ncbi:MAG: isoprenylcysteine carboxylmethyltransferase family protein [Candidatus Omnitrophota bacterium]
MKKRLKINGVLIFCVFLLVALFPSVFFRPGKSTFSNGVAQILGILFILLGQIIRISSRGFKSENSGNGYLLIQRGPYAVVRNPMYFGILLIGLGIVLALFKWWVAGIFLLAFVARYILLMFAEEKKLSAVFSKDYQDYCKNTPRIIPSVITIAKMDIAEYLPLKLSWIKKEIGSVSAVLLVVLVLGLWKDIRNEGLFACLKDAALAVFIIILFTGLIIYLSKRTASFKKDVSNKR